MDSRAARLASAVAFLAAWPIASAAGYQPYGLGFMSVGFVYLVSPGTAIGVAMNAVTIGLLLSQTLLWEGALCVVMATP